MNNLAYSYNLVEEEITRLNLMVMLNHPKIIQEKELRENQQQNREKHLH